MTKRNCVVRLSRYKNALSRFRALGLVKVFSDNLADAVDVTPSQVRKDFSLFGITGNKRGGYIIEDLLFQLNRILGKDKVYQTIIIGVGNLGTALLNYQGFEKEGIKIVGAFDTDNRKHSTTSKRPIMPLEQFNEFVDEEKIELGIITVPDIAAHQTRDIMLEAGIVGILNFSSIRLKSTPSCVINNVNLVLEFENLIYFINSESKV